MQGRLGCRHAQLARRNALNSSLRPAPRPHECQPQHNAAQAEYDRLAALVQVPSPQIPRHSLGRCGPSKGSFEPVDLHGRGSWQRKPPRRSRLRRRLVLPEVPLEIADQAVETRARLIVKPGCREPAAPCKPVFQLPTINGTHRQLSIRSFGFHHCALGIGPWNPTMVHSRWPLAGTSWHRVCSGSIDIRMIRFGRTKSRQEEERRETPARLPARDDAN
jgi:hypothetical protein